MRQLRTTLRSGIVLAGDGPIDVEHLSELDSRSSAAPGESSGAAHAGHALPTGTPGQVPGRAAQKKRPSAEDVSNALIATRGNVVRAAELLGSHPRQVYRWIKRYSLSLDDYRQ